MAFIVTVADHDAVGVSWSGVEVSGWRSVSSGIRGVNLQDLTHLSATSYSPHKVIFQIYF